MAGPNADEPADGAGDAGPGSGGAPNAGGAGGTASGGAVPEPDLGVGDGSDVVIIGDSYMNLIISGVGQSLVRISGQPYRQHAVPGTRLADEAIPNQYRAARGQNPNIQTVVMDGGGNDVLQGPTADCRAGVGAICRGVIDDVLRVAGTFFQEMATDGVQDVVYFFYPHLPGANADLNPALDYALPLVKEACANAPVDCHFVDTVPAFAGHEQEYNIGDNIHPNPTGMDIIGQLVYDSMVENGVRR